MTIGDRRTFFPITYRRLPDQLSVIAGPFSEWLILLMAIRRHYSPTCIFSTKRLSKHFLLKQRRTGYRPSALTRIINDSDGTGGAVLNTIPLRRKGAGSIASDGWRKVKRFRRATADRSPAQATERGAGGDQRSTLNTAWDSRKACHTSWAERRRLSPRQAGVLTGWHSYFVTDAPQNPRLSRLRLSSSPRRSPAPLRPHGLRDRGAERHHGYSPWTSIFYSQLQSRAFVPEARQIWKDSRLLHPIPTVSLCQTGLVVCSEGDRRSLTIVVQCECRDVKSTTFRQAVTHDGST